MLTYCDLIAFKIKESLKQFNSDEPVAFHPGQVRYDLHPEIGHLLSTKKTINVLDENGNKYRVTVEEIA